MTSKKNEIDGLGMEGDDIDDYLAQIEKTFQIDLTRHQQALSKIETVGEFEALLLQLVVMDESASCVQQRAFFRLRTPLISTTQPSVPLTPEIELQVLFPLNGRHRQWRKFKRLATAKGVLLEGLRPPEWSVLVGVAGFILGLITLVFNCEIALWLILGSIGWLWFFGKVGWVLPAVRVEDLTRAVVRMNYARLKPGQASRREVISVVRGTLSECVCEPVSTIHSDMRFV